MATTSQHVITLVDEAIRRALPELAADKIPGVPVVTATSRNPGELVVSAVGNHGYEVARYIVSLTVEQVDVPTVQETETPTVPVRETPAAPQWLNGLWGDVQVGDTTLGADGKEWTVNSITPSPDPAILTACVTHDGQLFSFSPSIHQAVTFRRATPRESSTEADSQRV